MLIILLTICAILTSVISGVIGMAGGIVLLSLMTFVLPWSVLIPVHGVVQLVSNSSRCYLLWRKIQMRIFVPFLIGTPFGIAIATFLVGQMKGAEWPMAMIIVLIAYVLLKPKKLPPLKIPLWSFSILGLVTGFFTLLIGATGPLLAPFFLRDDIKKEEIVATKAACQMVGHLFKLPAFFVLGFNYIEQLPLLIGMSLGAIVGTRLGVYLLGRIHEGFFRALYKLALAAAALRLLYKLIM